MQWRVLLASEVGNGMDDAMTIWLCPGALFIVMFINFLQNFTTLAFWSILYLNSELKCVFSNKKVKLGYGGLIELTLGGQNANF